MKFTNQNRKYVIEIMFLSLILLFFFLYFIFYMTIDRIAWYNEMIRQANIFYQELISIGR